MTLKLNVNGQEHTLSVPADTPLLAVLRNDLALNGPKYGCGLGECGACSVLIDGVAARACVLSVAAVQGFDITTLEGLVVDERLDPVQQAFIDAQAAQCGYCLNGMIVSVRSLLNYTPTPTNEQILASLDDNLCRCGTHLEILTAAHLAVELEADRRGARDA